MLSFPFWKYSPSGNPTILVPQELLPCLPERNLPLFHAALANALMHPMHLGAEQVGYVSFNTPMPELRMMGGEFCLNATRAFAALLAMKLGVKDWQGKVKVSGTHEAVPVRVRSDKNKNYAAAKVPVAPVQVLGKNAALVNLPGISHVVIFGNIPKTHEQSLNMARKVISSYELDKTDGPEAAGCMWLEESKTPRLTPVVWVRQTGSICCESACGSGTLASALALKARAKNFTGIIQPSGSMLTVSFENAYAWVEGPVELAAEGTAYVQSEKLEGFLS